jgi:hypothetical protein
MLRWNRGYALVVKLTMRAFFILMIKLAEVGIVRYLQIGVEPRLKRPLELVE